MGHLAGSEADACEIQGYPAVRSGIPSTSLMSIQRTLKISRRRTHGRPEMHLLPSLSLPARIVLGVDVVELHRSHAVDLHHHFAARHSVVVHVGIKISKAARRKTRHAALVEVVTHAHFKRPGNYRNVLALRMPMRSDAIPSGHLQAHRVVSAGCHWVPLQHRQFRSRLHKSRRWAVLNSIRCEDIFRRSRSPCAVNTRSSHPRHSSHRFLFMNVSSLISPFHSWQSNMPGYPPSCNESGITFVYFWCIFVAYW